MKVVGLKNSATRARFQSQAQVLKALAHPTRLFLLDELSHGKCSVRQLTELVGAEMSTVSKHLSLLKYAGLVADERHGAQVIYRLATPCAVNFFRYVEEVQASSNGAWYQPA